MTIRHGHARWAFDLSAWRPSRADLLLATACIQAEEKQRLAKFVFRNDFDASLIGRLLMRKYVRDTSQLAYQHIRFARDERGRPHLLPSSADAAAVAGLDFNVSHQGAYSVLAGHFVPLSLRGPDPPNTTIGVDVMKIEYTGGKPLGEFFRLMDRNFTAGEWANIRAAATDRAQTQAFMRHWCLKESYVKNTGVGISIDLQTIDFAVRSAMPAARGAPVCDTTLRVNGAPVTGWTFEESLLDSDHSVCVAVHHRTQSATAAAAADASIEPSTATPFDVIGFDELMNGAEPLLEPDYDYCTAVLHKEYKTQR